MGDHLGEHRVEVDADVGTGGDPGVPAHGRVVGRHEGVECARGGEEPPVGVLGVEAGLDGVARRREVALGPAQRLAGGDAELLADQVDAGDLLGDGVLDLEAGVDLEEEELAGGVVDEELDGSRRPVADAVGQPQCGVAHGAPEGLVGERRRRLLEHLLVPALDRALALAEVDEVAVGVAQHLDLEVAGAGHVALEEHPVVAEGAEGLPLRRRHGLVEVGGGLDEVHALAATAGGRLHEQRVADRLAVGRVVGGREGRDPGGHGRLLGGQLVAHGAHHVGGRPYPDQACRLDGLGEAGVLGQEAVAGVDGVGPGGEGGRDDGVGVEVAAVGQAHRLVGVGDVRRSGVGVDVHGDAAQAHRPCRAEHPSGDLAPVGDEDRGEAHSLNTP